MGKFEQVDWLEDWLDGMPEFAFEWDAGNEKKNAAKHAVTAQEVEEAFRSGQAQALGIQVSPPVPEERYAVIGPTNSGRLLQVVFTFRKSRIRVICARPASRKERKNYGQE